MLASAAGLLCVVSVAAAQEQQGDLDERLRAKDAELRKLRQEIVEHRKKIEEVEKKEKEAQPAVA